LLSWRVFYKTANTIEVRVEDATCDGLCSNIPLLWVHCMSACTWIGLL